MNLDGVLLVLLVIAVLVAIVWLFSRLMVRWDKGYSDSPHVERDTRNRASYA